MRAGARIPSYRVNVNSSAASNDDLVRAWSGILRLHAHLVPLIDAELVQATGMPLRWYDVLLELDAAPDRRLRMVELGDAVVLSRTRVSRVVDELVEVGYVTRMPNPEDGRSAFAAISAAGRRAFRRAAPVYLERIHTHLGARVDRRDATVLRGILERALDADAPATGAP
jgi:DNA-binding MarR family transcriptional regulator